MKVESKEKTIKERNQFLRIRIFICGSLIIFQHYKRGNAYEKLLDGGPGADRTRDTGIFNPLLYQLSYRAIYKTQKEKILGVEPSTFCLTDKCSTNELNFF